jgi:hypothetical protein
MSNTDGYAPLQEIRETSQQVFDLINSSAPTVGEFLIRYGSTTSYVNYAMPECRACDTVAGTTPSIGLMPYTRTSVKASTDSLYRVGATYEMNREVAPITDCDAYLKNTGSVIHYLDPIAPSITGFQEATNGMYRTGYAMQDIAAQGYGFVRVQIGANGTVT